MTHNQKNTRMIFSAAQHDIHAPHHARVPSTRRGTPAPATAPPRPPPHHGAAGPPRPPRHPGAPVPPHRPAPPRPGAAAPRCGGGPAAPRASPRRRAPAPSRPGARAPGHPQEPCLGGAPAPRRGGARAPRRSSAPAPPRRRAAASAPPPRRALDPRPVAPWCPGALAPPSQLCPRAAAPLRPGGAAPLLLCPCATVHSAAVPRRQGAPARTTTLALGCPGAAPRRRVSAVPPRPFAPWRHRVAAPWRRRAPAPLRPCTAAPRHRCAPAPPRAPPTKRPACHRSRRRWSYLKRQTQQRSASACRPCSPHGRSTALAFRKPGHYGQPLGDKGWKGRWRMEMGEGGARRGLDDRLGSSSVVAVVGQCGEFVDSWADEPTSAAPGEHPKTPTNKGE